MLFGKYHLNYQLAFQLYIKSHLQVLLFYEIMRIIIHLMVNLPSGVHINNLIDDIRIFSWQAADILLYYSKLLEDSDDKKNIKE